MEAVMEGKTAASDLLKDLPSRNSCHFSHYSQGSYKCTEVKRYVRLKDKNDTARAQVIEMDKQSVLRYELEKMQRLKKTKKPVKRVSSSSSSTDRHSKLRKRNSESSEDSSDKEQTSHREPPDL